MSNGFAPNRSYLCAERASHLTVKTYWLLVFSSPIPASMNHPSSMSLHPRILGANRCTTRISGTRCPFLKCAPKKSIRRPLHLHACVEAFCDAQVEFLCNASTEALRARFRAPGGTATYSSLEIGRCTTLQLISLKVGNDDFAATKKTRV
jgi:hypothetical protein